jgi:hypothetical protein
LAGRGLPDEQRRAGRFRPRGAGGLGDSGPGLLCSGGSADASGIAADHAGNAHGETILVWTEGTGWQKGGSLAWQVFDRSGRPIGSSGRIEGGVPVWGLATVVARPDGGFMIIASKPRAAQADRRPRRDPMLVEARSF